MEEDKQAICDALCKTLQLTRGASDLIRIVYHRTGGMEYAELKFQGSLRRRVNITRDSGTAMIRDILRHIYILRHI